jgi:hypothetical protein
LNLDSSLVFKTHLWAAKLSAHQRHLIGWSTWLPFYSSILHLLGISWVVAEVYMLGRAYRLQGLRCLIQSLHRSMMMFFLLESSYANLVCMITWLNDCSCERDNNREKTLRHLIYVLDLTVCLVLGMRTGEGLYFMGSFRTEADTFVESQNSSYLTFLLLF